MQNKNSIIIHSEERIRFGKNLPCECRIKNELFSGLFTKIKLVHFRVINNVRPDFIFITLDKGNKDLRSTNPNRANCSYISIDNFEREQIESISKGGDEMEFTFTDKNGKLIEYMGEWEMILEFLE